MTLGAGGNLVSFPLSRECLAELVDGRDHNHVEEDALRFPVALDYVQELFQDQNPKL